MNKISIVIPTCNRPQLLSRCLDSLDPKIQCICNHEYEIIVSDDSNNNKTQDLINKSYKNILCIKGPQKGPAANRNNGAKYARGEWLIFLDDDCIADKNLLKVYINSIKIEKCLVFEGAIHPLDEINSDLSECPINIDGGNFWSANIMISRGLFFKINGFDENFKFAAFEDMDLKLRIEEDNKIIFLPESIVYHPVRILSFYSKIKKELNIIEAWIYYVRKHIDKLNYENKFIYLKTQYKIHLKNFCLNFFNFRFKNTIYYFLVLIYFIPYSVVKIYR